MDISLNPGDILIRLGKYQNRCVACSEQQGVEKDGKSWLELEEFGGYGFGDVERK